MQNITQVIKKNFNILKFSLPILFGVLIIVNFLNIFLEKNYEKIFTDNAAINLLIGSLAGSLSFGIPITSYIVGGELLKKGLSLLVITAFIISWTTVGITMLPLEARFLGKKFAIVRNAINFIFSMLIAVLVFYTIDLLRSESY